MAHSNIRVMEGDIHSRVYHCHVWCWGPHQEKSKCTLRHLVTSVDLIKLNKVDSEGDLLNLSQNVLKIAYLRPQGARRSPKFGKVHCQGT